MYSEIKSSISANGSAADNIINGNAIIHAGNIGSQSVTNATNATTALTLDDGNNQWNWATGSHAYAANSLRLWDQYGTNGGSGYPLYYGSILHYTGRSGHMDSQLFFGSSGEILYRYNFYGNNNWNNWQTIITSSNIGSQTGQFKTTNSNGFKIDSASAAYITIDSANSWSYTSLHYNGSTKWDLGCYQGGNYEIRPYGGGSNRAIFYHTGGMLLEGSNGGLQAFADIKRDGISYSGSTYYIALSGHLSGYGTNYLPTLKTNFAYLYFDVSGVYTGYIGYNTGFVDQSDRSLKENIEDIPDALSKVMNLRGRYFTWKNELQSDERQVGFIAQEVEEQLPEVVDNGGGDTKGIAYGKVTALLVNAIKEQQAQIELLKQEVELLKQ